MTTTTLADKVVGLHRVLARSKVAHAFGGALALAYYAEPRATVDIDLNLFVGGERYAAVARPLGRLGAAMTDKAAQVAARDGQVRVFWERTPLDLFFAYDAFHAAAVVSMPSFASGRATESRRSADTNRLRSMSIVARGSA